jgi:hypothetical protein
VTQAGRWISSPYLTTGTVQIRIGGRWVAQELIYKQNHSNNVTELVTDPDASPCETSIQGAPHLDEQVRGSHYMRINGSEQKGLNIY